MVSSAPSPEDFIPFEGSEYVYSQCSQPSNTPGDRKHPTLRSRCPPFEFPGPSAYDLPTASPESSQRAYATLWEQNSPPPLRIQTRGQTRDFSDDNITSPDTAFTSRCGSAGTTAQTSTYDNPDPFSSPQSPDYHLSPRRSYISLQQFRLGPEPSSNDPYAVFQWYQRAQRDLITDISVYDIQIHSLNANHRRISSESRELDVLKTQAKLIDSKPSLGLVDQRIEECSQSAKENEEKIRRLEWLRQGIKDVREEVEDRFEAARQAIAAIESDQQEQEDITTNDQNASTATEATAAVVAEEDEDEDEGGMEFYSFDGVFDNEMNREAENRLTAHHRSKTFPCSRNNQQQSTDDSSALSSSTKKSQSLGQKVKSLDRKKLMKAFQVAVASRQLKRQQAAAGATGGRTDGK